jgi:hypothetical protein
MSKNVFLLLAVFLGIVQNIWALQELSLSDSLSHQQQNPFEVDHLPWENTKITIEEQSVILNEEFNFLFIVFIVGLIFLSIAIGDDKRTFSKWFRALNSTNFLKLFLRDSSHYIPTMLYILYVYALISLTLFLYLLDKTHSIFFADVGHYYLKFSLIFIILVLLLLAKQAVIRLLGYVFSLSQEPKLYNFSMMMVVIALGLTLTPINAVLAFGSYFEPDGLIFLGLFALGFFYIFQQIKGLVFARQFLIYRTFHFFLYICTVELLPILILAKMVRF